MKYRKTVANGTRYWKDHFSTGYRDDKGDLNVDANQTSLIVSILSAGTFFGALLSGRYTMNLIRVKHQPSPGSGSSGYVSILTSAIAPVADFFGRRLAMIINTCVFTVGVILQTAATDIPLFVAGRFFAGLGVGLLSATIPLYQSETAPKWIRGAIVGCYQVRIPMNMDRARHHSPGFGLPYVRSV
jgi:MFS transporter, SP family, sugar:H+ symporter